MMFLTIYQISKTKQYLISTAFIVLVAAICFVLHAYLGYKVTAFVLLISVSLLAIIFDIVPVLLAATLSALIWNFFFIPPRFTFSIGTTEDIILFFTYFLIAMVNAVLTYKIRQLEKEARKKEEKANTIKLYNTLISSLSHELKTPIATIIGASDSLISDEQIISDSDKKKLAIEISTASFRLNQQVSNLLNMSRLESGFLQLKKDWCDVNELVYSIINRLEPEFKHHSWTVMIKDNLPLFKLDYGIMEQVLYNLVYNAILYTPKYCVITLKADCVLDRLRLIVADNGNGFPEDEKQFVFDKFYRLKNTKTGGTGLGLSIVKGFVEAHGGTIRLENEAGGGARFVIDIPTEISYINQLKNE
jgi:two-component system, OmpR family, sensor histidine kinase KdpD